MRLRATVAYVEPPGDEHREQTVRAREQVFVEDRDNEERRGRVNKKKKDGVETGFRVRFPVGQNRKDEIRHLSSDGVSRPHLA